MKKTTCRVRCHINGCNECVLPLNFEQRDIDADKLKVKRLCLNCDNVRF